MSRSVSASRRLKDPDHSFGLSVGGAMCTLAALSVWRHHLYAAATAGLAGGPLLVLGLTRPRLLAWPRALWWRLIHVLGYVNSRVLLTVIFTVVIVPINAVWRLTGKDPLARRRRAVKGWSAYPPRYRDRRHYSRMY